MSTDEDTSSADEKVYDSDDETTPRESTTTAGSTHHRGHGSTTHYSNTNSEDAKADDATQTTTAGGEPLARIRRADWHSAYNRVTNIDTVLLALGPAGGLGITSIADSLTAARAENWMNEQVAAGLILTGIMQGDPINVFSDSTLAVRALALALAPPESKSSTEQDEPEHEAPTSPMEPTHESPLPRTNHSDTTASEDDSDSNSDDIPALIPDDTP